MRILITGVAGFIGCNLAQRFLSRGDSVVGLDNLSRGAVNNLAPVSTHPQFVFESVDLADIDAYRRVMHAHHANGAISEVWHLAANSDIPAGIADAGTDLRDTFMTTHNTLLLMRELGIGIMAFASSSAVYGDLGDTLLTEVTGPLLPVSNYGAMKLASEAAISAALESYLNRAFIFRFPNVVGVPATHGVILDFVRKLRATPSNLAVLGDGTQCKSYLHGDDLISAMLHIRAHAPDKLAYYNIGPQDDGVTVRFIAETVVARVSTHARITYGAGNKGWVGDVPKFSYSTAKLSRLGWHPEMGSAAAIRKAVDQVAEQESPK
jgi:UDP-glucose 4-epimerase